MTSSTNVMSRKAVLANLTIDRWGARKFDDEVTNAVLTSKRAEKDAGLFTKRLLNKEAMKDIDKVTRLARVYHHQRTQPWLDNGVRILPTALYLDYAKKQDAFRADFKKAVEEFVAAYPTLKEQAQKDLGQLFDEADYPSASAMRLKFGFKVVYLPCPDTADFRVGLDKETVDEMRKSLDTVMKDQIKASMTNVAERITETIGHMAKRLKEYKPSDKEKGKKGEGKFRDSLVEHVKDLADLLPAFNMNDDPKLIAVHKRIVKELCVYDADTLRADDQVRKQVARSAKEIVDSVSDFLA